MYVTKSYAIASSVTYNEIRQNFSNSTHVGAVCLSSGQHLGQTGTFRPFVDTELNFGLEVYTIFLSGLKLTLCFKR